MHTQCVCAQTYLCIQYSCVHTGTHISVHNIDMCTHKHTYIFTHMAHEHMHMSRVSRKQVGYMVLSLWDRTG